MRCSLFFTALWILVFQDIGAQNPATGGEVHWIGKYGLYMKLDSGLLQIPVFHPTTLTRKADTLLVPRPAVRVYSNKQRDSIAYLEADSAMAQEDAVFKLETSSDSIVLIPLNFQAKNLLAEFGMSHAPMLWHLTPERPDYFPQKAPQRDKLVFYPVSKMAENIPWDKLYLSLHQPQFYWFPESNFDLTIYRDGTVQIDCESGTADFYGSETLQNNKSYQMQLTKGQMDTLLTCLNMQILIPISYEFQNIGPHQSIYHIKFGDYDASFGFYTSLASPPTILTLQSFMQTLISHPSKKEIPFVGFRSPCTFVKNRN